ncbi:MAG: carboxypeptidase-like regulatory domain-containing protein [Lewinellaceae bacterium]|nr:carboxypeptidase-like regulatory domain-containing protein [Saprospiraceae bacterium]MCB9330368.1 carboxypeptidase-like regulatory domain-containing protein [Lewinellaceae bacterium]
MINNKEQRFTLKLYAGLFLLFFIPTGIWAQLSGVVYDENGEPLPYASVYVRNSTNGTVANAEGQYRLSLNPGTHYIVFQYIGYKQQIEKIEIANKPVRLDARLEPSNLELSEVVITTEDPAYPIMRKAIAKRNYYKTRTPEYSCDAYIKGFYKLLDAPKKILGQEVGDIGGILDSNRTGVLYLSESVSKLYVQAKPLRKKEVMVSSKVSGNTNGFSLNRATLTDFSLYDEYLEIDRNILSPLADNAFAYYRFRLLGRFKDENNYDIYKIEVIPKRDEDPTFHGHIYIVDEWWNLAGVDLKLTGKAIQQPVLDTLVIQQEFVPVNKPDEWCLLTQLTGFKFAVLGFKVSGFFNGVFSNYNLKPQFPPGTFDRETFRIEKSATERDTSYWETIRPVPLTEEESNDYVRKDSLEKIWESKTYLDSIDRKSNRFKPTNLIFGYTWRNSYRHTSISYPALFDGLQFNTVQGVLLNIRPTFRRREGENRSSYWEAGGSLNYGFAEKRLRADLRLERRFESIWYTQAEVSGGLKAEQFDPEKQIGELTNLLYSLFDRRNYLKLYEKAFVQAKVGRNVAPGLRLEFQTEFAERRPLINHSDYSFYRRDREYAPNAPLPIPATVPEQDFFETHKAFLLELAARIRIGETFSTYPDFRIYHRSKWPGLVVRYTKAVPGVAGSVVDFDLIQLRLAQSDLSLGLFGSSSWNAGGGVFWRKERVEFMDYFHPKGNQTFLGKPSTYNTGFFLLPYYEFSTADAYTYAHLRHFFNGWILDKIPGLRKLNWKENLGIGFYYADQYAWENQRSDRSLPYWELSFGFYNIGIKFFRPLHIDLAVGFMGDKHYRTGVVLGFDL